MDDLTRTLRERDAAREMLKTAMAFAHVAIWELDIGSDELRWEGDYETVWGKDSLSALKTGEQAFARIIDADRERVQLKIAQSIENSEPFTDNFRIDHPDGTVHWLAGRGNHKLVKGRTIMTGINYDITELKHREHMAELLTRELHHRIRNLFATVRAIISLTKNSANSVDDYVERIDTRLRALDRAQTVLLDANFLTGSLHALMREMTSAYPRISYHGDDIQLPENALVALALVFNEMATNAAKYGSLSARQGYVTVSWQMQDATDPDSKIVLDWREIGGPVVTGAPDKLGFGSQLIQRSVTDNLKGTLSQTWSDEGMAFTLTMPGKWYPA
jgi:PAS domain S-box-containing protein